MRRLAALFFFALFASCAGFVHSSPPVSADGCATISTPPPQGVYGITTPLCGANSGNPSPFPTSSGGILLTQPQVLCTLTATKAFQVHSTVQTLVPFGINAFRVCVIGVSSVSEAGSSISMNIGWTPGTCDNAFTSEWIVIPPSQAIASFSNFFGVQFGDPTAVNPWFSVPAGGSICTLYNDLTLDGSGTSQASIVIRYVSP